MATCVKKEVATTVVKGYTLELTPDEAAFLKNVLNRVGGNPDTSPRRHSAEIFTSLQRVFAGHDGPAMEVDETNRSPNVIYYKPYPGKE